MLRLNPYAQIDSQETAGSDANEATEEKEQGGWARQEEKLTADHDDWITNIVFVHKVWIYNY